MLPTYCTLFFIQEYNLLFPIPKKNVILIYFSSTGSKPIFFSGQLFKFDGYN